MMSAAARLRPTRMKAIGDGFGNGFADSGGRACDEDGGDVGPRGVGFIALGDGK